MAEKESQAVAENFADIVHRVGKVIGRLRPKLLRSGSNDDRRFAGAVGFMLGKNVRFSAARYMEKITAYYPVICTTSMNPETMSKIPLVMEERIARLIGYVLLDMVGTSPKNLVKTADMFRTGGAFGKANLDPGALVHVLKTAADDVSIESLVFRLSAKEAQEIMREHALVEAGGGKKDKTPFVVDKANDAAPTVLTFGLNVSEKEGDTKREYPAKVILPVKCTLHPVEADELLDEIANRYAEGTLLTKLIRWKTGELRFFRDLIQQRKEMKELVNTCPTKRGKQIVNQLLHVAVNRSKWDMLTKGQFMPTSILALTAEDVEYMKSKSGKDLSKRGDAADIMKRMGLSTIVVVNEATETLRFRDDGGQDFDMVRIPKSEKDFLTKMTGAGGTATIQPGRGF